MNFNFKLLILFFTGLVSTAQVGDLVAIASFERRRALEKSLLRNLQAHHAGVIVKTGSVADRFKEDDHDEVKGSGYRQSIINMLCFDTHQYILSFLNPRDLLSTRRISRLYRSLSDYANYSKICQYNPKFVLNENWMNLALSNFLFEYFKNGSICTDDLFYAEESILFSQGPFELQAGNYPACFNFLSFIYEYEKGVDSSLPMFPSDLYLDILSKIPDQDLPMAKSILNFGHVQFVTGSYLSDERKSMAINFSEQTIQFIASKPDSEAIKAHFNFDPSLPLERSRLKLLPPFLRIAVFELILPLCDSVERFEEAIQIASSAFIFPQFLLDQLNEKFPDLVDEIFHTSITIFSSGQRAYHEKYPADIVGLDYLLTRNAANPFNLQELIEMNPYIPDLIEKFLPCNAMSLTEADMISQMKVAGLFDEIQDRELLMKIDSVISGEIRLKRLFDYSDILITICCNYTD